MGTSWENFEMVLESEEKSVFQNTAGTTSWWWPTLFLNAESDEKSRGDHLMEPPKNWIDHMLVPKRWKTSMLDTVALVRGDFDCDHTLVTAFIRLRLKLATKLQKKVQRFRTEILKDESTRNRYRMNLDLALKTLLENSSMNTEERDLDALAKKRSEIFRQTAKTVLGRANGSEKPWITDEIIQLCKDKRVVANRQDPEIRDIYKYLKRLTEKKI